MKSFICALPLLLLFAGCSQPSSARTPHARVSASIEAGSIYGMFVCEQLGLLVMYTFLRAGGGLATIDTDFHRTCYAPAQPGETAPPDEGQTVTLVPTVTCTWTLTPPNLLTIDFSWPGDKPQQHYLRVERLENGQLAFIEMEAPTGPDLGLMFHVEHGDILAPAG